MGSRVLLIDRNPLERKIVHEAVLELGHELMGARTWLEGVKAISSFQPDIVLLDMSLSETRLKGICSRMVQAGLPKTVPVIAISTRGSLKRTETLLSQGFKDCLWKPLDAGRLLKKINLLLEEVMSEDISSNYPPELASAFADACEKGGRLGDMAEVFGGLAPRKPAYRRMASPGPEWRPVLTADVVSRYAIGKPNVFLKFDRTALFRLPSREEFCQEEKVIIKRTAPPVAAAVDRSATPVAADLYSIVPAKGLECGYICALLNSRLMDFYLNRVRPLDSAQAGTYLRNIDIEAMPVVLPSAQEQAQVCLFERELAVCSSAGDRSKARALQARVDEAIFRIYSFDAKAVKRMQDMHF